jgi:hypothetical protein
MSDDSQLTVSDIFDALGGPAAFARALELKGGSTASEMKRRGSIPVEYWPRLVAIGVEQNIAWLTYEELALMHARKAQALDAVGAAGAS